MPHPDLEIALTMLECCRFAYKAYAQSCVFPMDPFYESHGEGVWQGARDRVMKLIHESSGTSKLAAKFDPIQYKLDEAPHPMRAVVYRGGTGTKPYIYFPPHKIDRAIAVAMGVDIAGGDVRPAEIHSARGAMRCCHFQGMTGMTKDDPGAGWRSWLGAVLFSAPSNILVVVFRGSRSGAGGRAAVQGLAGKGSPDWVTDMDHLKPFRVKRFDDAKFSAGFWLAYASCKKSLETAVAKVLNGKRPVEIRFTGHSLGGALAQCAYVDMMAGGLFERTPLADLKDTVPAYCYPISAPPIVLGKKNSPAKVRKMGREENVFHFFLSKDAVHESKEVKTTGASMLNSVISTVSHPMTSSAHLGREICLPSSAGFPAAHEPAEVRKALCAVIAKEKHMGLPHDPHFWPEFTFNVHEPELPLPTLGQGLKTAFLHSIPSAVVAEQASLWEGVQKISHKTHSAQGSAAASEYKETKKETYLSLEAAEGEHFGLFAEARECLRHLGNPFISHEERAKHTEVLVQLRRELLKIYGAKGGAKNHKATSAVAFMMLQCIAALHYASLPE